MSGFIVALPLDEKTFETKKDGRLRGQEIGKFRYSQLFTFPSSLLLINNFPGLYLKYDINS